MIQDLLKWSLSCKTGNRYRRLIGHNSQKTLPLVTVCVVTGLDEKDEEIADILISLGMNRSCGNESYLPSEYEFSYLSGPWKSGKITPAEVSIAMRQLKERDWIDEREEKKSGKDHIRYIRSKLVLRISFHSLKTAKKISWWGKSKCWAFEGIGKKLNSI